MGKFNINDAELLAQKFRATAGLSFSEPVDVIFILRKFRIFAMFRPLSMESYGISVKTENAKFMMINSNSTVGRQHFTIAHELYHLFYDENPQPHICKGIAAGVEKNANLFASALLMPSQGIMQEISPDEMKSHNVKLATVLRLEQLFGVSRNSLLLRLKDLGIIGENTLLKFNKIPKKKSALEYGYTIGLYENGNEGIVIGDFGEKARRLFDEGKISEGHYLELLNMIYDGKDEN